MKEKENAPEIELYPDEWRSERGKPIEPVFGKGLPFLFRFLVAVVILTAIKTYFR